MKKFMILTITVLLLPAFSSLAYASNAVSQMATTKGGRSVAECAKIMDKGVSECAHMAVCDHMDTME